MLSALAMPAINRFLSQILHQSLERGTGSRTHRGCSPSPEVPMKPFPLHARRLIYILLNLMVTRYQRETLEALLGLFLQASGRL